MIRRACIALILLFAFAGSLAAAEPVVLSENGEARMSVVCAEGASKRVKAAAADLAEYLSKITGGKFHVVTGEGTTGIAVGRASDFPELGYEGTVEANTIADRELCVLRSHGKGLHVIGATELAVEDAVWGLLHRIGYRQYFPADVWEIVPSVPDLRLELDVAERPDYLARRIWYSYGTWGELRPYYNQWCLRNRARSGFRLNTGHAYEGLISRNQEAFDVHPEYYGLVDGKRTSTKICIGNPALRKLICEHAIDYFTKNPDADSISMDPSDGGGWCQCEQCAALGSVSDRALTLANQVAAAVNQKFKNKYVGMYGYAYHSPPPNIRVHPNVIISVASAFIKGGYTYDQIVEGWSAKGATLGVRDYFAVNVWCRDLPGRARGGNLKYLTTRIPGLHEKGARFYSAESGESWGPYGLGFYVAARVMWDVDEAKRLDAIVDDFMANCFKDAEPAMREYYELLDASDPPIFCDSLVGRMYRILDRARKLEDDPAVRKRLDALILYTRYVELFRLYSTAKGKERQKGFEELIRHSYRMRRQMMTHSLALWRDLPNRDGSVFVPANAHWQIPEAKLTEAEKAGLTPDALDRQIVGEEPQQAKPGDALMPLAADDRDQFMPKRKQPKGNIWKSSKPYSREEIDGYLAAGIKRFPVFDVEPVKYSEDLVPATRLGIPEVEPGHFGGGNASRGRRVIYTWIDEAPYTLDLKVTGGLIYRDRGPVKLDLVRVGPEGDENLQHIELPPDGKERVVKLQTKHAGLHKVIVNDRHDKTRLGWPENLPITVKSSLDEPSGIHARGDLYFYVPRGRKELILFAGGDGWLIQPDGKKVMRFQKKSDFHRIPVPEGQDGRLWKFGHSAGTRRLINVPPYLAPNLKQLLLPREVVEQDAPKE